MSTFLIFPNQLFENPPKYKRTLLVEDPVFYYDAKYKPFRVNKAKIAFLHSAVLQYVKKYKHVQLISWIDIQRSGYDFLSSDKIVFYDPLDNDLVAKYTALCKSLDILESPDLLLSKKILTSYFGDNKKLRHASFYAFMKQQLGILEGVKNMDKSNRSPPPSTPPNIYKFEPRRSIYEEGIAFANKYFADHYGDPTSALLYPVTHKDAKKAFESFLLIRLKNFGLYEDAVMQEDPFMYHSVISPMMNIGLLTPKYVIKRTLEYSQSNTIPLSSLEGFLRQISWRCFMQGLYIFRYKDLIASNLPQNSKNFKDVNDWYNGETGLTPLDEEIKKASKIGYAHHIVRLMIFMNIFIMCEIHPYEIYKWFMEVVSIDAYSWVMIPNIYAMGYFYPNATTRPYLCSSNYISKMTNYKKDGQWDTVWDALYHSFVSSKTSSYTFFYKRNNKSDHHLARVFKSKYTM